MDTVLSVLSFVLPAIVALASILVISINVYLKIRRRFPVRVNCWFCNENTKIEYDEREGFECPSCLQYNGFNEEGDYNKPIPAQYDEMLNRHLPSLERIDGYKPVGATNGLCHLCNNNQQLKVYQLANFIPLNEANYDAEIEHFQKQLEKSYRLCPRCDKVVKTTVQKQICALGLKLAKLRRTGTKLLDLNRSYDGLSRKTKLSTLIKLLNVALITFALLNVCITFRKIDISDPNLHLSMTMYKNLSDGISTYIDRYVCELLMFDDLCVAWNQLVVTFNRWKRPELLQSSILLCCASVFLQTASLALDYRRDTKKKLLCLFLWATMICSEWTRPYREWSDMYVRVFQIVTSAIVIILTVTTGTTKTKPVKLKNIKRVTSKKMRLQQLSDCEEDDDYSSFVAPPLKRPPLKADLFHHNVNTPSSINVYHSSPVGFDINASLNSMNLGTPPNAKRLPSVHAFTVNHNVSRPRPVISPSKLRNVTQNSWVAGGFWRDPNGILFPFGGNPCGLSRSSSQTSGFVSLDPHHSPPSSLNNSFCGDGDHNSVLSEAACCAPQQPLDRRLACHNSELRHIFYPAMNHEPQVYIAPFGFNSCSPENLERLSFRNGMWCRVHKLDDSMRSNWYDKDF